MDAHATDRAINAIYDGDQDALRAALAAGADPNASVSPPPYFIPMIHQCAATGLSGMCTLLVTAGADVHALAGSTDRDLSTLASAITGESHEHVVTDANVACVRILLEAGADPNTRIMTGARELFTFPLHLAIAKGSDQIARLLIGHGAGLELRATADGSTALYAAVFHNQRQIVLTLLRAGAVPKVLRRRNIRDANEALSDFMVDMVNDGGWNAYVQRHRDRLLGAISRCVRDRLPHEVLGTILGFWSPPGGHRPWASSAAAVALSQSGRADRNV